VPGTMVTPSCSVRWASNVWMTGSGIPALRAAHRARPAHAFAIVRA
jgi:hypothetical protein